MSRPLSFASDPGGLTLSTGKLKFMRPDLFGFRGLQWKFYCWRNKLPDQISHVRRQLANGDSRAAIVLSIDPLLIAAYTDEMDAVAILALGEVLVPIFQLQVGSRLLTTNLYGNKPSEDLFPGPRNTGRWTCFNPLIADFVSDDVEKMEARKARISEEEWTRCWDMGHYYIQRYPGIARDGRPIAANLAAEMHRPFYLPKQNAAHP